MTDEQLKEIAARAEAATPGPWKNYDPMTTDKMEVKDSKGQVCCSEFYMYEYPECYSNGEFIAHARTDIPALLAHIAHQRQALGWLAEKCATGICAQPGTCTGRNQLNTCTRCWLQFSLNATKEASNDWN